LRELVFLKFLDPDIAVDTSANTGVCAAT